MSKLLISSTVLVFGILGVVIASLVFNIIVYNQLMDDDKTVDVPTTTATPGKDGCPTYADVSTDAKWKEVSTRMLATVDFTVDPCEDFYQFSCAKYIKDTDLNGLSRQGTYDEAQYKINLDLANYFDANKLADLKAETEKYQKNFLDSCVADGLLNPEDPDVRKDKWTDLSKDLNIELGFPMLGVKPVAKEKADLFTAMGTMERLFTGGPLMTSFVTADFADHTKNALYLNQPALHFTRDYFTKPQYLNNLQQYAEDIRDMILAYSANLGLKIDHAYCDGMKIGGDDDAACALAVAQWAVDMERSIAMASWPDEELRNYKQQYTPFSSLDQLDKIFPQLFLGNYVRGLLQMKKDDKLGDFKIVISQPTYFSALEGQFDADHISLEDYTNYLAIHFLMDNANEYGIDIPSADPTKQRVNEKKFDKYITRRGHGARKIKRRPLNSKGLALNDNDELRTGCIDALMDYMPYGPGYTYVKNRQDRDEVRADVKTMTENIIKQFGEMLDSLDWIDDDSLARAHKKSTGLIKNYLWPDSVFGTDFTKSDTVDKYNHRYVGLLNIDKMSFWDVLKQVKTGLMTTEQFDIVDQLGDRSNFLQSPAVVNAWYQPERNSITFPFGILNPPYYDLLYPQAYNYAGQGGTGGHELTHGYDDEGTQFDEQGELADCEFTHCSILDDDSRLGFTDMAQCVVQQYNTQCCPLKKGNVRCANGATTQGENIADIGGQQAAYRAYLDFVGNNTEARLPGLEQYSPNQIFWMTYGVSWCMKITDERLTRQLMTDPHAPSSCRVNQVMQDIPQFGFDFKCKRGSPMYPSDDDRCKVWIGY